MEKKLQNSKVLFLFDPDKYLARNDVSDSEFNDYFKDILPDLYDAFEYAFEKMCAARSKLRANEINSRWPANAINRYLYSWLTDNPHTCLYIKKKNNTFYLERGNYRLTFKKVDSKYRPSYALSKQSQLLERNLSCSDNDLNTVVFIGYRVDSTWSKLIGVYAICRKQGQLKWITELKSNSQMVLPSAEILPFEAPSTKNGEATMEPEVKLKINNTRKVKN